MAYTKGSSLEVLASILILSVHQNMAIKIQHKSNIYISDFSQILHIHLLFNFFEEHVIGMCIRMFVPIQMPLLCKTCLDQY